MVLRILWRILLGVALALKIFWQTLWAAYQIALGILLAVLLLLGFRLAEFLHFFEIRALRESPPASTAFMEADRQARLDSLRAALLRGDARLPDTTFRYQWLPLAQIPRLIRDLALVAEDAKFYRHPGFDFEQIEYALVANHQAGKPARGASTISQQVAKNLFLSGDKAMTRKLHEAAITVVMEEMLGKDRILELYLNIAQFGPGIFGVLEGSRYHFGKHPKDLTEQEALSLITLLPSPEKWRPDSRRSVYLSHKRRVSRNYALFRGRNLVSDTAGSEAEAEAQLRALDEVDSVQTEERWKPLLREAPPLPGDTGMPGNETLEMESLPPL